MAIRYGRTNENGLVIPPTQLDCIGEECPTALVTGRCFVDEHHLYFPRAKFARNELYAKFAESPFNIVRMARCRHNSRFSGAQHTMIDDVRLPDEEVVHEFLWESHVLTETAQLYTRLESLYEALETSDYRKQARNPVRYLEVVDEFQEELQEHERTVQDFEVIPSFQRSPSSLGGKLLYLAQARLQTRAFKIAS